MLVILQDSLFRWLLADLGAFTKKQEMQASALAVLTPVSIEKSRLKGNQ